MYVTLLMAMTGTSLKPVADRLIMRRIRSNTRRAAAKRVALCPTWDTQADDPSLDYMTAMEQAQVYDAHMDMIRAHVQQELDALGDTRIL